MAERVGLKLREDGPRVVIEAERPDDGKGLYKAWLLGGTWSEGRSGRFLLGTMIPDGESRTLRVRRTISIDELRRHGVWPALEAEAELTFPFEGGGVPKGWQPLRQPGELFRDPVLRRAAEELEQALLRREEGGFLLAAPYGERRALPLTPAFCFARLERLDEALYMVYRFDNQGWPIF